MRNVPYEGCNPDIKVTIGSAGSADHILYSVVFRSSEEFTDVRCVESNREYNQYRASYCSWGEQ